MDHAYIDITFANRLSKRVHEAIEKQRDFIEAGSWQTAEQARYQIGYVKALRDTMVWIEDTAKEIAES